MSTAKGVYSGVRVWLRCAVVDRSLHGTSRVRRFFKPGESRLRELLVVQIRARGGGEFANEPEDRFSASKRHVSHGFPSLRSNITLYSSKTPG